MYAPQQYGQQAQYAPQQQQYYQQPQQQYYQPQPQMQQQYYQQPQQYQQEYQVPAPAPYVNTTYSTAPFDAPAQTNNGYEILSRNVVVVPSPGAAPDGGAAPAAASTPRVGEVIGRTVTVNDAMQKLLSQMDQQAKLQAHMKGQQEAWLKDASAVSAKTVAQQQQPTVSAPVNMQLRSEAVARTNTAAKDFVSDMKAGLF